MIAFLESGGRLPRPPTCPEALHNVMLECWRERPEDRPSFEALLDTVTAVRQQHVQQALPGR